MKLRPPAAGDGLFLTMLIVTFAFVAAIHGAETAPETPNVILANSSDTQGFQDDGEQYTYDRNKQIFLKADGQQVAAAAAAAADGAMVTDKDGIEGSYSWRRSYSYQDNKKDGSAQTTGYQQPGYTTQPICGDCSAGYRREASRVPGYCGNCVPCTGTECGQTTSPGTYIGRPVNPGYTGYPSYPCPITNCPVSCPIMTTPPTYILPTQPYKMECKCPPPPPIQCPPPPPIRCPPPPPLQCPPPPPLHCPRPPPIQCPPPSRVDCPTLPPVQCPAPPTLHCPPQPPLQCPPPPPLQCPPPPPVHCPAPPPLHCPPPGPFHCPAPPPIRYPTFPPMECPRPPPVQCPAPGPFHCPAPPPIQCPPPPPIQCPAPPPIQCPAPQPCTGSVIVPTAPTYIPSYPPCQSCPTNTCPYPGVCPTPGGRCGTWPCNVNSGYQGDQPASSEEVTEEPKGNGKKEADKKKDTKDKDKEKVNEEEDEIE